MPACSPPTLPAAVLRGPGGGIAEGGGGLFGGAAAATPQPAAAASETDVVVISDRKVQLPQPSEPEPSFYRLCRQWVQNDPDLLPPDEVGCASGRVVGRLLRSALKHLCV